MSEQTGLDRHFAKTMMALFPQKVKEWAQDNTNPKLKYACETMINAAKV